MYVCISGLVILRNVVIALPEPRTTGMQDHVFVVFIDNALLHLTMQETRR